MKLPRLLSALLVAGLISVTAWSCRQDNVATGPSASPVDASLIGDVVRATGLLQCTPLPYASDAQVIGPEGGTLHLGPHVLRIPRGALSQPVLIRGEAPTDDVNSVRFFPEGLRFARPASLTMSYQNCNLLGRLLPKRIAYTTERLQILSYLLSLDNILRKTVTGRIEHFSRYAVAW
jgi:hypothetical protein